MRPATAPLPAPRSVERTLVRIVRVNSRLNVGGIARHVAWLTAGLESAGYQGLLIAGTVPEGEEDMTPFVRAQGVEPLLIPEMSREVRLSDLCVIWKLYRIFLQTRPHLVHTHAAKAGTVARLAGLLYRWLTPMALLGRPRPCRFVHTFHGHVFHSYYSRWKTGVFLMIEKLLARLATDRIVVLGPQQFEEIHGRFGIGRADQYAVIRLGLDLQAFAGWPQRRERVRSEMGAETSQVLVGIVGRLTEIKNHALFLRMAARFRATFPELAAQVRFLIIGNGHLRESLEAQAATLNVKGVIRFLGNREDPEYFYPALDIVALTSRNEGTPLTLIEGMANARAVIATNVGGVVDLLGPARQHGDGFDVCARGLLVRPDDADAFSRALAGLVGDAALRRRLGASGQDFVEQHYSKERLLQDVADLYAQVLGPQMCRTAPCSDRPPMVRR